MGLGQAPKPFFLVAGLPWTLTAPTSCRWSPEAGCRRNSGASLAEAAAAAGREVPAVFVEHGFEALLHL